MKKVIISILGLSPALAFGTFPTATSNSSSNSSSLSNSKANSSSRSNSNSNSNSLSTSYSEGGKGGSASAYGGQSSSTSFGDAAAAAGDSSASGGSVGDVTSNTQFSNNTNIPRQSPALAALVGAAGASYYNCSNSAGGTASGPSGGLGFLFSFSDEECIALHMMDNFMKLYGITSDPRLLAVYCQIGVETSDLVKEAMEKVARDMHVGKFTCVDLFIPAAKVVTGGIHRNIKNNKYLSEAQYRRLTEETNRNIDGLFRLVQQK